MGTRLPDLRYGARMLRKNSGFTAVAVLSLGLGIGANTAIFQLLDAVRLRTIPVKDFTRPKVPSVRRLAFVRDLLDRMRTTPGVVSAGEVGILPLSGGGVDNNVWLEGSDPSTRLESNFSWIGPGYLGTMGMTLLSGRDLDDRDTASSPKVAIVNQSFARRFGLGPDPVGKRFRTEATPSAPEQAFEIVGLVRDTKYYNLREEFRPIAFLSPTQSSEPDPCTQVVIRSTAPLTELISRVRSTVAEVDPAIGLDFRAFETTVREGLLRERLMAALSSFFGGLATLIAAIGLYDVMSYLVVRRTNEIGIRMALGADARNVLALVLRESATLLALGLLAGTGLALAAARTADAMLFGLKSYDPGTLALAAALLAAVTGPASYLPARRAARLDPMAALREE